MKKSVLYIASLFALSLFGGCKKEGAYPGGELSPYIAMLDLRDIHKGEDITLTKDNMFGATRITGIVVSDPSGGNLPAGLLVVQDSRRLSQLRGIAIPLGSDAAKYVPGDSVIINVEGGVLKRTNGILQLTGISNSNITKAGSGRPPAPLVVKASQILTSPGSYESVLVSVAKAGFDLSYPAGATYAGDRIINDGFGNLNLHTEATASWADKTLPFLSNFTGIVFRVNDTTPKLWPRVESDVFILSATAPKIASLVIAGFLTDPPGGAGSTDANYEYIQLLATKNLDFSVTPFSIVTTNNAGASTPTGYPANGWATGDLRTYKINLTSGTVNAGQYLYVGANKNIWGAGSTDLGSAKWFIKQYSMVDGDGFGKMTTNLLANSGNGAGIAVFDKTAVDASTVPVDVIFYGGAGMLYAAPSSGYRITNTDYYDEKNPTNLADQPYYTQGSNTGKFGFPALVTNVGGSFAKLGGKYNKSSGRWTSARALTNVLLTPASQLADLETGGTAVEQ